MWVNLPLQNVKTLQESNEQIYQVPMLLMQNPITKKPPRTILNLSYLRNAHLDQPHACPSRHLPNYQLKKVPWRAHWGFGKGVVGTNQEGKCRVWLSRWTGWHQALLQSSLYDFGRTQHNFPDQGWRAGNEPGDRAVQAAQEPTDQKHSGTAIKIPPKHNHEKLSRGLRQWLRPESLPKVQIKEPQVHITQLDPSFEPLSEPRLRLAQVINRFLKANPFKRRPVRQIEQGLSLDWRYFLKYVDFAIIKLLGKGAYSEVYLVRNITTGDLFAMKVV